MTTNRAFIKAYRHDAAQATPSGPAITGAMRPAATAIGASIEYVAAATDCGATPLAASLRPAQALAGSIDVLPPSVQAFVDTTLGAPVRPAEQRQPAARPVQQAARRVDRPAAEKRPLSAYIGRQRAVQPAVHRAEDAQALRPGTTVASFRWPALCRTLSLECRAELDRVADRLLAHAAEGRSVIGLVGLFAGQGCTTAMIALAARLAIRKHKVLLVDGDFRRPQLAPQFDVVPTAGWQEVLENAAPLSDALIRAADDGLDLLALSPNAAGDPLRLAAGRQIEVSAGLLRRTYDLVLVDLGAFFEHRSVVLELVRSMTIDAVLAVDGPDRSDPRDLSTIAERLGKIGCQLLGTIENRVAQPRAALHS